MAAYMADPEIKDAAAKLRVLIDEVLAYKDTLDSVKIDVYQPHSRLLQALHRLPESAKKRLPKALRTAIESNGNPTKVMHGISFATGNLRDGETIIIDNGDVVIATYFGLMGKRRGVHILHSIEDYLYFCILDVNRIPTKEAVVQIDKVRYQIERRLPDGHASKRVEPPEVVVFEADAA